MDRYHLDDYLTQVAVLGACGKMGRGIAFLLLKEIVRVEAERTGKVGSGHYLLFLIDVDYQQLLAIKGYLRSQLVRYAEKKINLLRFYFSNNPSLVSNAEIIGAYVEGAMDMVCVGTNLEDAKSANLIFEAIVEDIDIKCSVFSELNEIGFEGYFLSNTSSIPIGVMNDKAELSGKIIGFHFYNPAPIQQLVEIITPEKVDPELLIIAQNLAKRMKKKVIYSKDVAGFVGNGYFIREIVFACDQVRELAKQYTFEQSLYLINWVTQNLLLRPMGIFQLIDYVGIDVVAKITEIMSSYLNSDFLDPIIEKMIKQEIYGGQSIEDFQSSGFFHYDNSKILEIYSPKEKKYLPISNEWIEALGTLPKELPSWRKLIGNPNSVGIIGGYFEDLLKEESTGALIARKFLERSREIARTLVREEVAETIDDVETVLKDGFYHLYGTDMNLLSKTNVQQS